MRGCCRRRRRCCCWLTAALNNPPGFCQGQFRLTAALAVPFLSGCSKAMQKMLADSGFTSPEQLMEAMPQIEDEVAPKVIAAVRGCVRVMMMGRQQAHGRKEGYGGDAADQG